ncbi:MAG: SH3 domain-containing protein, partial [Clostridiales bacterium]|nr:SH3 domain-containing protein [Clostridiales bacterium]
MSKKIIGFLLSLVLIVSTALPVSLSAFASDYETELIEAGFPKSYATALASLHSKYPNWKFEPLITGVTLNEAVANERTPHSQQLIQKTSSNIAKNYLCTCSSCYKNGNYVIQEGSTWVSASQSAVEYYMNPENFLTEKYIFQFESNLYNSEYTISGIETIIKNTWMSNSLIKYKNASGKEILYTNSIYPNGVKYSQAIMEAAEHSGLSPYYLASKIVQEVGGKTNSAAGASGTNSTYPGIYNYYNIGATGGALDGLKWASTSSAGYTTNANVNLREKPTTSSSKLVTIPNGTNVNYISTTAVQQDGYKWINISVKVNGKSYTGYVRSDLLNYSESDKYKRPWNNPYTSIYHGAKYIANNFGGTQNTGYLQKFNVNPASSNMYSHEYMANVQAAASEASNSYNAYVSSGLLSTEKTFLIPVFSSGIPAVTGIKTASYGNNGTEITLTWNSQKEADSY